MRNTDQDFDPLPAEVIPESAAPRRSRSGFRRFLLDIVETLLISALLFVGINWISARIRVDGFSMEPSMHSGEFVIVNKLAYRMGSPQRGDIIVFRPPRDREQEYIKRVIGLPGERVVVAGGQMRVDGRVLDEPYILQPPRYRGSWDVPAGHLFVLGDNRNNSSDSHNWGPVPISDVIGKALIIYWPVEEWGLVDHRAPELSSP